MARANRTQKPKGVVAEMAKRTGRRRRKPTRIYLNDVRGSGQVGAAGAEALASDQPTLMIEPFPPVVPSADLAAATAAVAEQDAAKRRMVAQAELDAFMRSDIPDPGADVVSEGDAAHPDASLADEPTEPLPAVVAGDAAGGDMPPPAPDVVSSPPASFFLDMDKLAPKERNPTVLNAQARLAGRQAARFIMGTIRRRYQRRKATYLIMGAGAGALLFMSSPAIMFVGAGAIGAKMALRRLGVRNRAAAARSTRRDDPALHPDISWAQNEQVHALRFGRMVASAQERVIAKLPAADRREVQVRLAKRELLQAKLAAFERSEALRSEEGAAPNTVDVMASRRVGRHLRHRQELDALERSLAPVTSQAEQVAVGEFGTWATKVAMMRRSAGLPDLTGPDPSIPAPDETPPKRKTGPRKRTERTSEEVGAVGAAPVSASGPEATRETR